MKRPQARSYSPPIKRIRLRRSMTPPPSFVFNEVTQSKSKNLEKYIQKLEGTSTFNNKYKLNQYDSTFQIVDVPEDPEALLAGIFTFCLDESRKEARQNNIDPDFIAITIRSPLLDPHIYLPYRPFNENTTDVLLHEFLRVAQSKKQQGLTLWGEPFSIKIYNVDRSKLPITQQIIGGGTYRKRKLNPVRHVIKKKAIIKVDNKDDHYCLFYSLQAVFVRWTRKLNTQQFKNYIKYPGKWKKETIQLMHDIGIPFNLNEYDAAIYVPKVVDYWNMIYKKQFRFKTFIFGHLGHYQPKFKYGPDNYTTPLILYHDSEQKHFHGVRKAHGLFNQPYCLSCESTYNSPIDHTNNCRSRCRLCSKMDPSLPCKFYDSFHKKCLECSKIFNNYNCYRHHLDSNFCDESKKCEKCGVIWSKHANCQNGREKHVCGETWCSKCKNWHDKERSCFIEVVEPKERIDYRIVAFDFETTQNNPVDIKTPNDKRRKHKVNFIAAKIVCPQCIKNEEWKQNMNGRYECDVCGENRTVTFGHRSFSETEVDFHQECANPIKTFVDWILHGLPEEYQTHAFAHNGGRFDFMFICRELYKMKINPKMTKRGNKIYELRVDAQEDEYSTVVFWDSFNLLTRPLAALVPMFELEVKDKPYFPYLANRKDNYGIKMPTLPPKEDYLYKGFMPAKRKLFDKWYEEHYNDGFFLDEALASYCMNDVDILMAALVAFRTNFMTMSKREKKNGKVNRAASKKPHEGLDPLRESMTIASACMKLFRMNHLKKDELAVVTDKGYDKNDKQSTIGMKFLRWYADKYKVQIQHAHSPEGEKKIGKYEVDGWIEKEKKIIEYNGCPYHGCPICYPDNEMKMITGKTAGWHRQRDKDRLDFIKSQGYEVEVYWGCQVDEMLTKDKEMAKSFDEYLDEGPIDIRSSFYGGRTGPIKLYYKPKAGEKISYFDVTSLYPYTNFMHNDSGVRGYPVGIPKLVAPSQPVSVWWTHPHHNPHHLAILKVFIIPPRKIDVPVLPMKFDKKDDVRLLFPLCSKCAREHPKGGVNEDYECLHSDMQRGWVSTCTSVELEEALKAGYIVRKFYRAVVYENEDRELFRGYMRECLAGKFHASGFDANIKGNAKAEEQFIKETKEKFGIEIDPKKMIPNKGLRELEKMRANNLWGRFGLRNYGLAQTIITDDPFVLRQHLENREIEVTDIEEVSEEVIMITYLKKKDWTDAHESSNVVISLWTTSCARVHLLKLMQQIARSPGCTLLYTDTDSVIYAHPENSNPLQTSPHLGGLTDEYPNHDIIEYVSGGAKQYGLKLLQKNNPSASQEYILKIRGMTLNEDVLTDQGLRYETFKNNVLEFARTGIPPEIPILYPNFLRPNVKKGFVISTPLTKIYKPFVSKGIIRPSDFKVLDYGYTL